MFETRQPILLGDLQVQFKIDGQMVSAPARVFQHLWPTPLVVFEVSEVPRNPQRVSQKTSASGECTVSRFPLTSEGPSELILDTGVRVGVVTSSWFPQQTKAELHLLESPSVVLDAGKPLASVSFSLLNCISPIRRYSLILEASSWSICIDPASNLSDLEKIVTCEQGYAITHKGIVSRADQGTFSINDVSDLLVALEKFLSFVCGSHCSLNTTIGIDSRGKESWKRWGSRGASQWHAHRSWFDITTCNALFDMFPVFLKEWQDSKEILSRAVDLYAHSNNTDVFDVAIILSQVALECLAYLTIGSKSEATGIWIARALQQAGIPTKIPPGCGELEKLRKRENWVHGPHTIVEIRNSMTHSKSLMGAISIDAYYEAMNLSLWYLELLLLKKFQYNGEYASRLAEVQRAGATEPVPWTKGIQNQPLPPLRKRALGE